MAGNRDCGSGQSEASKPIAWLGLSSFLYCNLLLHHLTGQRCFHVPFSYVCISSLTEKKRVFSKTHLAFLVCPNLANTFDLCHRS